MPCTNIAAKQLDVHRTNTFIVQLFIRSCTPKMRSQTALLLFLAVVAAVMVSPSTGADSKQKLQIGVKKRIAPEDCPIKSRKGDRLKMHYTVRTEN